MLNFDDITPLKKGDKIGIVSVSSPVYEHQLEEAINFIMSLGYKVEISKDVYDEQRFMAGGEKTRAENFMHMWEDENIKAVLCARGGYSSQRILEFIDYDRLKNIKKLFIGFSDNTALQLALYKKAGIPSITGFSAVPALSKDVVNQQMLDSFFELNKRKSIIVEDCDFFNNKDFSGELVCGCLTMFSSLVGTQFFPDLEDKVLLIEDVGEEPYQIDRKLSQLHLAKDLNKLKALIFGEFKRCKPKNKLDGTILDVVFDWANKLNIPVVNGFPYGHYEDRVCLPLGGKIISKNEEIKISLT